MLAYETMAETKAFSVETKTKTFSFKAEARPSQGTIAPSDDLETEATSLQIPWHFQVFQWSPYVCSFNVSSLLGLNNFQQ